MADGGHVFSTDGIFFFFLTKTLKNPTCGLRGDVITSLSMGNFTKSEPGTKRPNLSTDRNLFCFVPAQLGIGVNTIGKFHSNPSSTF